MLYDSEGMIVKPEKMSERWFRKMHRQEEVTVNGQAFTLQTVSPSWYFNTLDQCGMTGADRRDTYRYLDLMLKNVVVEPVEVSRRGMRYFDDLGDIETPEKLSTEIDRFLHPGKRYDSGAAAGKAEG